MKKVKKAVSILLSLAMAGISVVPAFAAKATIPHAFGGGGDAGTSINNPDHNRAPFDGTYHAKDGSSIVISGAAVTFNGKTYTANESDKGIDLAYSSGGGVMDDFKTSDGIYGSVMILDTDTSDGYSFHPFMNKSGTGLIVVKLNEDGSFPSSYTDSSNDLVVPSAVAYTKDGTVAVIAPTKNYKIDTGAKLAVKSGKTYQFKITASSKPTFACGNGLVFKVKYTGSKGSDYFFKVTATGKVGQAAGFYVNREKAPCTVAAIA